MDRYIAECRACWCKVAQRMMCEHEVFFNCNACPFTECYEPDTKEKYISGTSKREEEYARVEEAERLGKLKDEEYRGSQHFRSVASFAATIRKRISDGALLSKSEFTRALRLCRSERDSVLLEFISFSDVVRYQLSAMGYKGAGEEIASHIKDLEDERNW